MESVKKDFPHIETTKNFKDIIHDKSIHAVVIATPVTTHKALAEEALFFGKHVFIEKPMTSSADDAELLNETAKKLNKIIAVGHVFQFSPAVRKIKELLQKKAIGNILHITSTRINLGPPETEVDVIWDLGPHDFSIILYLLKEKPYKVTSTRNSYPFSQTDSGKPQSKSTAALTNNAHIDLSFKSGITAHIHLSWLSSNKTRMLQIFGTEGTIVYDEMLALDGKVKLFGRGVDNRIKAKDTDAHKLTYSSGEIQIMSLEQHEPLRMECQHFINSIINDTEPINNGSIGLEVVKLLETSSESFSKSNFEVF